MKKLTKILALIICLSMCVIAVPGCGSAKTDNTHTENAAGESSAAETPAEAPDNSGAQGAADIEPIVIRSAYTYQSTSLMGQYFQYFQDYATELSDGAITFDVYWGASLVAADDALDSIGTGVADIGNGLPVRTPTLTPFGGASFYFPFRPENLNETYEIMTNLMVDFTEYTENVEQYNIKLLGILPTPGMQLCSTTPIERYEDLAGLKVAAAGADYSVWESAGAVVVSVAGDARYENLQRGIVDASYLDLSSIYTDHSYEVAPYITYTGLGDLATVQIWANQDFWAGLSDGQRSVLEQALALAMDDYIAYADEYLTNAVSEMEAEGCTFYTLSEENKAAWAANMENLPLQFAELLNEQGLPGTEFVKAYIKACEDAGHVWNRDWLADF